MGRRLAAPMAAVVLLATLTGCTDDGTARTAAEPSSSPTGKSSSPAQTEAPGGTETTENEDALEGGTAASPAAVEPTINLLKWTRVPGPATATVTRSGAWTLSVAEGGGRATLQGPSGSRTFVADSRQRISDGLIDGDWAAVVFQDEQETQPATAQIVRLGAKGGDFTVDASSDVPTTTGGTWALGDGTLVHPTIGPGGSYCLATVDLEKRTSERTWCAEKRHGFNAAQITPAGTSLMTFDDQQPSCRTVAQVASEDVVPFDGVEKCLGWEGVLVDDGAVWSVVPKQNRVEEARYYARSGDAYFDLGPGTSGTLAWCGGATYFAQDPVRDGDPARLLRWTPAGELEVVYETRGRGPAFLTEPRCGGDRITVTAVAESGDEQVSAPAG
ncbi:MAG TPA: hypothetical protein VFI99_06235 [Nocardioides sp.]|nr:hypothetical protein [Nocardioides sp.]